MKYAYETTDGYREIMGCQHPIRTVVYKTEPGWVAATICNGVAEWSHGFRTRKAAIAWITD